MGPVSYKRKTMVLIAGLLIAFLSYPVFLNGQAEERKIVQAEQKITIDGSLEDWEGIAAIPVKYSPSGHEIESSSDVAVIALFSYDAEHFFAAVKADDDTFEFPSRSWRYGDGFTLTFLDPYSGPESDRFTSFGVSIQGEEETFLLVNRDGEYFPQASLGDVRLKILGDAASQTIAYEVAIPWKNLLPFKPFLYDRWGINLIYVDRDQGRREILQIHPDQDYDTELSKKRKGEIFRFVNHVPEEFEFQVGLNGTHFYHDEGPTLTCAVNAPQESRGWKVRYDLTTAADTTSAVKEVSLEAGMNRFVLPLDKRGWESGMAILSVGLIDADGSLRFREDMQFFVLNREAFDGKRTEFAKASQAPEAKNEAFLASLPTLEIRFDWIRRFMDEAPPFADIAQVDEWHDEVELLSMNIAEGKPALFPPGTIARLAHRSAIDGTLQPYSVAVPPGVAPEMPAFLFVTLHGSGVDERRTIQATAQAIIRGAFQAGLRRPFIVLAPQARGLSDWYLGDSGRDVIECVEHIQKLYAIDTRLIVLDGFSMGGYGAWRLGILHPDLFRAVIVRSGATSAPAHLDGEDILDLLDRARGLNLFIIHGEKDNAVPVENAREAVAKLKELGIKHTYVEVKDAAHGGYDRWKEIFAWLRRLAPRTR